MKKIVVIENNETGMEHYYFDGNEPSKLNKNEIVKRYACLTDALEDSETFKNDHYSDGECLDWVFMAIKQLEEQL